MIFVVAAPGPSLDRDQAIIIQNSEAKIIAVNDAYRMFDRVDILYGSDAAWWKYNYDLIKDLECEKVCMQPTNLEGISHVENGGRYGLSLKKGCLANGKNSSYAAMNLALQLGAERIVFVGLDLKRVQGKNHFFGEHPEPIRRESNYNMFIESFLQVKPIIADLEVEVINCTPNSALGCFPKMGLEEALCR